MMHRNNPLSPEDIDLLDQYEREIEALIEHPPHSHEAPTRVQWLAVLGLVVLFAVIVSVAIVEWVG